MKVLKTIAAAFSMFSAIPVPAFPWEKDTLRFVLCAFPLVGAVIGLACWGWTVLCGFYLGAAYSRCPVLLDGLITCAAALCAGRLCPKVRDALLASHCSAEPAAALALEELDLAPLLSAGLRLGEGSGAAAALPLLDMALRVYHSGNTFDAIGIEAYRHLS